MSDTPTIKPNIKKVDPGLKDLLDLLKKDIFLTLNCHAIATVQSFDPINQTIQATINYKKSYVGNQSGLKYELVDKDYPILIDMPVVVIGGGGFHLTMPISKGDECLICFNDRAIDTWFSSGQVTSLPSPRTHSFSDGIAIVGVNSIPNKVSNYDGTRAVLRGPDGAMVGVGADKVKIANAITTLNTLLQDLCTQLQALTVTCTAPGSPSSIPNNAAAIATIATQIAGLLE